MERFQGIVAQLRAEGNEMDSQVLDVSDVEVVEVKVHEGLPLVVVQFQVQQINCVRDRSGRIVEGAADDIQSVYYVWAVEQQFEPETFTAKWMLCEMAVRVCGVWGAGGEGRAGRRVPRLTGGVCRAPAFSQVRGMHAIV